MEIQKVSRLSPTVQILISKQQLQNDHPVVHYSFSQDFSYLLVGTQNTFFLLQHIPTHEEYRLLSRVSGIADEK